MGRVITFGTFDLLHNGHIQILERAKELGHYLIVGISTDRLNASKGKLSIFSQDQRVAYVKALACVDEVFLEKSLEDKEKYVQRYSADLLVMGSDWEGKFDWVSCQVKYLPRTEGVSSSEIKTELADKHKCKRLLFGDTYIQKHYDCALTIVNEMTSFNIAPIFTDTKLLPKGIECDCLVYFNKPVIDPPEEYKDIPRVLIDHGASTLKWFLASQSRFNFFDSILTAGPDHAEALLTFFPDEADGHTKIKSVGFIKSKELFSAPKYTRKEIAKICGLNANLPIILFAPTWHIFANIDMVESIKSISKITNEVTSLHPETVHLNTGSLNVIKNVDGMTLELLKHADCVISDTSSTLFEAAALRKPTVQLLFKEYSDNNAVMYDFPFVAGTCDLFCAGIVSRPEDVEDVVSKLLVKDSPLNESLSLMQSRVLKGTIMREETGNDIVKELIRSCDLTRLESPPEVAGAERKALIKVHENMFYAENKLIAHGGGNYNKLHASNSLEALKAATSTINVVEIDLVKGADGVIVAHDTFEEKYGLDSAFKDTSVSSFLSTRFQGELKPTTLEQAIKISAKRGKAIVCDIKSMDEEYVEICSTLYALASSLGVLDRVIIQCYCVKDFEVINRIGFKRSLLAVWKYFYRDPLGIATFEFLERCMEINSKLVVGVSIPYINKHMKCPSFQDMRFAKLYGYWKRIYIHGAPPQKYPEILRMNIGLFADNYSSELEFKDCPKDFNWKQYLFLNRSLVSKGVDNQVSATVHFLKYGLNEGRLYKYDVPEGFNWGVYIEKNPNLRAGGVGCVNSAKAHWTNYGLKEKRKYK